MDYQQLYNKYYSRMSKEGILKSFVFALLIGFGVTADIALTTWIVGFDAGVWIALGGLVVVTAAVTPIFYYCVFRPTEKSVAKRLDSLGMEERIITMQELQGDTSVMANLQRADAVNKVATTAAKVGKAGGKIIAFNVAKTPIIITACVGCLAAAATTVTGLSSLGIVRWGKIVFAEAFTSPTEYSVLYRIYGEDENNVGSPDSVENKEIIATLKGSDTQKVKAGGSTGEVLYTANKYYYFLKWMDGFGNEYSYEDGYTPSRHEDNVNDNLNFKAQFDKLDAVLDDGDLGRLFDEGDGGDGGGGGGGGGNNAPGNVNIDLNKYDYIINNMTKYIDNYDTYYGDAMEYIANNNLSAEERAMMETYFNILL